MGATARSEGTATKTVDDATGGEVPTMDEFCPPLPPGVSKSDFDIPPELLAARRRLTLFGLMPFALYVGCIVAFLIAAYITYMRGQGLHFLFDLACAAGIALLPVPFLFRAKTEDPVLEPASRTHEARLVQFVQSIVELTGVPGVESVALSAGVEVEVFGRSSRTLAIGMPVIESLGCLELRAVIVRQLAASTDVGPLGRLARAVVAFLQRAVSNEQYVERLSMAATAQPSDLLHRAVFGRAAGGVVFVVLALMIVDAFFRGAIQVMLSLLAPTVLKESALSAAYADRCAALASGKAGFAGALGGLSRAQVVLSETTRLLRREAAHSRAPLDAFEVFRHVGEFVDSDASALAQGDKAAAAENGVAVFGKADLLPPGFWAQLSSPALREQAVAGDLIVVDLPSPPARELLQNGESLRQALTRPLLQAVWKEKNELLFSEQSTQYLLAALGEPWRDRAHQGVYTRGSLAGFAVQPESLVDLAPSSPPSKEDVANAAAAVRDGDLEFEFLSGLRAGWGLPTDGMPQLHGEKVSWDALAMRHEVVAQGTFEDARVLAEAAFARHAASVELADELGRGWPKYLAGLRSVWHYAAHAERNVSHHVHWLLSEVERWGSLSGMDETAYYDSVGTIADRTYFAIEAAFHGAGGVELEGPLGERYEAKAFRDVVGDFHLVRPDRSNIHGFLAVLDGWRMRAGGFHERLAEHALSELLLADERIRELAESGGDVPAAPPPSVAPSDYPVRPARSVLGPARKYLTKPAELMQAPAPMAWVFSFVALLVLSLALYVGLGSPDSDLLVYNGLDVPVVVEVGQVQLSVEPLDFQILELDPGETKRFISRTQDGVEIESVGVELPESRRIVYNVGGSGALVWEFITSGVGTDREALADSVEWASSIRCVRMIGEGGRVPFPLFGSGGGCRPSKKYTSTFLTDLGAVSSDTLFENLPPDSIRRGAETHARFAGETERALVWIEAAEQAGVGDGLRELLGARPAP